MGAGRIFIEFLENPGKTLSLALGKIVGKKWSENFALEISDFRFILEVVEEFHARDF